MQRLLERVENPPLAGRQAHRSKRADAVEPLWLVGWRAGCVQSLMDVSSESWGVGQVEPAGGHRGT
jgi:hypothetical protein